MYLGYDQNPGLRLDLKTVLFMDLNLKPLSFVLYLELSILKKDNLRVIVVQYLSPALVLPSLTVPQIARRFS